MTIVLGEITRSHHGMSDLAMMADTMIWLPPGKATHHDILPGRLKLVIVAERLSVGYSGEADRALEIILGARSLYLQHLDIERFIRDLGAATRDGRCDFLVASTGRALRLVKLWNGQRGHGRARYALGDPAVLNRLTDVSARYGDPAPTPGAKNRIAFLDLFNDDGTRLAEAVGGCATILDCRPEGHQFIDYATSISCDGEDGDLSAEAISDRASGVTNFTIACIASRWPNAPVLGLYLPQAQNAYIYAPLSGPGTSLLTSVTEEEVQGEVDLRSLLALETFPDGVPNRPVETMTLAFTPGHTDIIDGPPSGFETRSISCDRRSNDTSNRRN